MISLILKLIMTAAVHLSLFVCYPETGPHGDWYLWISLMLWCVLFMSMWTNLRFIKLLTFPIASFLNTGIFLAMAFFIILTMPQRDGKSVFKKLNSGQFPTSADIETGKIKYLNGFLAKTSKVNLDKTFEDAKKSMRDAKQAASELGKGE